MNLRIDEKGKYFTSRIAKDMLLAYMCTGDQVIVGHIYVRPDRRLKDELDDDASRFLPVTNARVYDRSGECLLYETAFLLVAYRHLTLITPIDAVANTTLPVFEENIEQGATS
jgi:hypothetical protein